MTDYEKETDVLFDKSAVILAAGEEIKELIDPERDLNTVTRIEITRLRRIIRKFEDWYASAESEG